MFEEIEVRRILETSHRTLTLTQLHSPPLSSAMYVFVPNIPLQSADLSPYSSSQMAP